MAKGRRTDFSGFCILHIQKYGIYDVYVTYYIYIRYICNILHMHQTDFSEFRISHNFVYYIRIHFATVGVGPAAHDRYGESYIYIYI